MKTRSCKAVLLASAMCISLVEMRSQNLVPNPSFETTVSCPNNQDQLSYATPWVRPTANTPDYYNACTPSFVGVPKNWFGYQYAEDGNAYAGLGSYAGGYGGNGREYLEVPLLSMLEAGKTYCVSFYVSLADSSLDGISPIGAYFSGTPINNQSTMENLPFVPQVSSPLGTTLSDTAHWTLISGSFVANGDERYMLIGTFVPDSLLMVDSTIRPLPSTAPSWATFAYYYIDNVSVSKVSGCTAGNTADICVNDSIQLGALPDPDATYAWEPTEGLNDATIANPKASPQVTTTYTLTQTECEVVLTSTVTIGVKSDCITADKIIIPTSMLSTERLYVTNLETNSILEVFNMMGQKLFTEADYQNDFWADRLSPGVYIVYLTRPDGEIMKQKLCVVK